MSRLDELFRQFAPVLPKGKGGNRRKYDDGLILEKAIAIRKAKGTKSKTAAVREAVERFPKLAHGDGTPDSIVKRIARQM